MILKSFKQALMRKIEERTKEKEELNEIEKEQRAVTEDDSISKKKSQCMKILGEKIYNDVYNYLKEASIKGIPHSVMMKEISNRVENDNNKLKAIFTLKQIINIE